MFFHSRKRFPFINEPFFTIILDLEEETGTPKSTENDSRKDVQTDSSISQQNLANTQDNGEETVSETQSETSQPPKTDSSLHPKNGDVLPDSKRDLPEESQISGDKIQNAENSKPEKWNKNVQPIESILADWKEDIEAFEMMDKDEL